MGGEEATSESDLMDDEVTSASGDDCKVPAAVASKTRHAAEPRVSQKASTHTQHPHPPQQPRQPNLRLLIRLLAKPRPHPHLPHSSVDAPQRQKLVDKSQP